MSQSTTPNNRRHFGQQVALGAMGLAAGTALAAPTQAKPVAPQAAPAKGNPIAVSTYSFWRFSEDKKNRLSIEQCIDEAARMGFDAVEILHMQMFGDEDPKRLQRLKRQALVNGLDLCGFSTHQGFIYPDKAERQKKYR